MGPKWMTGVARRLTIQSCRFDSRFDWTWYSLSHREHWQTAIRHNIGTFEVRIQKNIIIGMCKISIWEHLIYCLQHFRITDILIERGKYVHIHEERTRRSVIFVLSALDTITKRSRSPTHPLSFSSTTAKGFTKHPVVSCDHWMEVWKKKDVWSNNRVDGSTGPFPDLLPNWIHINCITTLLKEGNRYVWVGEKG